MPDELEEVRILRLKLKAARGLIRELLVAATRAEEALERAHNAQPPKEAQRDQEDDRSYCAVA
jgi:hypothetical protein